MTYRILNIWGDGGHVTLSALSSDNRFLRAARPPKGGRRAHLCWSYILEGCGEIVLNRTHEEVRRKNLLSL